MKKNMVIILLTAGVILLLYILFTDSCQRPTVDHSAGHYMVMKDLERLRLDSIEHARYEAQLLQEIDARDSVIQKFKAEQQQKERELSASKATAMQLRAELQDYRQKDTGYVYARFDSLLNEVDNLVYLLDQYQQATDSLTTAIEQQKDSYESLAARRAELISNLRTSYELVNTNYQRLYNDHGKLNRKLRNEKIKTKIAVVIAVAAGVLAAMK